MVKLNLIVEIHQIILMKKKFLKYYKDHNYYDFQGSTWAPHLIHKDIWDQVGGFSEEFFPGTRF